MPHEADSSSHVDAAKQNASTVTLIPSRTGSGGWPRWIDRLLVAAWLLVTAAFLWAIERELDYRADAVSWNCMWESAPLAVATDAAQGRPIYGDWYDGPVHPAIYGPLFYKALGWMGAAVNADHATMITLGRWNSIAFLAIGLLGVVWFVRSQGGPPWAALAALGCAGLFTPTAVRFIASARPDAMAAALSVLGLTVATGRRRGSIVIGVILLSAAWLTKTTAIAAPATVFCVLVLAAKRTTTLASAAGPRGAHPWRRPILFGSLMLVAVGATIIGLTCTTHGWFQRHLEIASAAPISPEYAWHMLTRQPAGSRRTDFEVQVIKYLFIFPGLAVLTVLLVRQWQAENAKRKPVTNDPSPAQTESSSVASARATAANSVTPFFIAALYFALSMTVAILTAMRQGSDRNYLIEPTLAAGMMLGTWASRMAAFKSGREWFVTRAAVAFAIFNPLLLYVPDRLHNCDANSRITREAFHPYNAQALAWARTLPQPLLAVDSWLPYRAGVANDLSDPIAYASYCLTGGRDPIAERVKRGYYGAILTMAPADGPDYKLYGDLGTFWPALREAVNARYRLLEHGEHGPWYVYVPRRAESAPH